MQGKEPFWNDDELCRLVSALADGESREVDDEERAAFVAWATNSRIGGILIDQVLHGVLIARRAEDGEYQFRVRPEHASFRPSFN
jgi:hypothetical protein